MQRNRSRRVWGADQRRLAQHRPLDKTASAELLDRLAAGEAFGRAAEPWEVAATIAFLASDYSSYLTGEVISVSCQHP
ncbi:oxidoreductase [Mycobacterium tuberculosis]|nr:oxidoreductase [Mycobacterium tuberculosis]